MTKTVDDALTALEMIAAIVESPMDEVIDGVRRLKERVTISDIHALEKERDEWRSRVRDWCELVRPHSFSDETAEQTIARMAAAERERDEARVNAKYEHGRAEGNYEGLEAAIDRAETADQRIIELEEALSKLQSKMLLVSDIGFAGLQDLRHIISCALSPAPAQPATAAKEDE